MAPLSDLCQYETHIESFTISRLPSFLGINASTMRSIFTRSTNTTGPFHDESRACCHTASCRAGLPSIGHNGQGRLRNSINMWRAAAVPESSLASSRTLVNTQEHPSISTVVNIHSSVSLLLPPDRGRQQKKFSELLRVDSAFPSIHFFEDKPVSVAFIMQW